MSNLQNQSIYTSIFNKTQYGKAKIKKNVKKVHKLLSYLTSSQLDYVNMTHKYKTHLFLFF